MTEKNSDQAQRAVQDLLKWIGEDPGREGLLRTPHRVVKALSELTSGYHDDPKKILSTTFENQCDEMVVVKNIRFFSMCEHHILPFHGMATVGYLPKGRIVGLSKIGRLVHCFARRLQVQERMTEQIAHSLMEFLEPHGVGVIVKAQHLCMEMRGIKTPAEMLTSCLLGQFRDPTTRAEFLTFRDTNS